MDALECSDEMPAPDPYTHPSASPMSAGIVYILVNEFMPGVVKIGKTRSPVEQRMRELDTTGVPLPFECFYAARVADADLVESKLHDAFADQRIRQRREFFLVDPVSFPPKTGPLFCSR